MNALSINVSGLLKETAGAARDYSIEVDPDAMADILEDARPVTPLAGTVRLMRTPQSIFARGRLRTRLGAECSRCLEQAEMPVQFNLDAEFYPEIDIWTGRGLKKPDDDLAFMIDQNHELDLTEPIRQHLLLELPMSIVCRVACAGLCPRCGANLNDGPCSCAPEVVDERLAPLRALLEGRLSPQ